MSSRLQALEFVAAKAAYVRQLEKDLATVTGFDAKRLLDWLTMSRAELDEALETLSKGDPDN